MNGKIVNQMDARSGRGIMSRGKGGLGKTSNPLGINQSTTKNAAAARMLLEKKRRAMLNGNH